MRTLLPRAASAAGALAITIISVVGAGCVPVAGTRPHDMGVTGHEAAAAGESRAAAAHEAQYDPDAQRARDTCHYNRHGVGGDVEPFCWSSRVNPTREHRRDAEEHRRLAEKHRAAAQSLMDAEAQTCAGIAPEDRDMSPFHHREDIAGVEPLRERTPGKTEMSTLRGATVRFRAVPGMTAEWLQRLVDCHLARNAALGHDVPEMPYCPLTLRGVTAKVSSTGDGFAVAVRSDDPDTAARIFDRAVSLVRQSP